MLIVCYVCRDTKIRPGSLHSELQRYTFLPKAQACIFISDLKYPGRTRFERLLHIGRSSVPLCVDALTAAVQEAKAGSDILRYQMAVNSLFQAAPNEPEAILDKTWMESKEKENRDTTAHLQAELQSYKNNMIKESIRVCSSCATGPE